MSFRLKIILGIAIVEVIFLTILIFSTISLMKKYSEKNLFESANLIASLLAKSAADGALSSDLSTLDNLLTDLLRKSDLVYARIISQGDLLIESGDRVALEERFIEDTKIANISDNRLDISAPMSIEGMEFGRIEMGFSMAYILAFQESAKNQMLLICFIELLFSALFSLFFGVYLTKKMRALNDAAYDISAGKLDIKLDDKGNDEFAHTAKAFNDMANSLIVYKSDKEKKEQELQSHKDKLEELVALRTQKLEHVNQQLQLRAEALQRLSDENLRISQARSDFLANMSHEIRTPMNGVIGMLGLLKKEKLTDNQKRKISVALSSANSLLSIINDILDFSKIDAGKFNLEILEFDLQNLLEDFIESMSVNSEQKGVQLSLRTENMPDTLVKGDPGRIRQVLSNLVGNAIKFTNSGSVTISVSLITIDEDNYTLHGSVKDTGIGIPEDKLNSIFDVFSQADLSTTRKYGGTGLGLSIVKELCELMDGRISATSKLGEGSEFVFDLALGKSDSPRAQRVVHPLNVTGNLPFADKRVLLVDDNQINQEVGRGMLEDLGITVDVASDGFEAIALLKLHHEFSPYDLVLMDCQMPTLDGYEATEKIREGQAGEKAKDMPIIAMTANVLQADKERCYAVGMNDYIAKPVNADLLKDKIQLWGEPGGQRSIEAPAKSMAEKKIADEKEADFDSLPTWDKDGLFKRVRGKPERVRTLLEMFQSDFKEKQDTATRAISVAEFETATMSLHSLKGSSANMGAKKLAHVLEKMERASREKDKTTLDSLSPLFLQESNAFLQAIKGDL